MHVIQLATPAQDLSRPTAQAAILFKIESIKPSPQVASANRRHSPKIKNFPASLAKHLVSAVLGHLRINVLYAQLVHLGHSISYTIYAAAQMDITLTRLAVVALLVLHLA